MEYSYFYYHVIKKIKILSDIFNDKLVYAEIISHFHSSIIDTKKEKEKENQIKENVAMSAIAKVDSNKINPNLKKEISTPLPFNRENKENKEKSNSKENNNNSENEEDSVFDELQKMMNTELNTEDIISKYKQVEDLFYSEMNFYEFIELVFFICRKYYLKLNPNAVFIEMQIPKKEKTKEKQKENQLLKQKEKETIMEIINLIYQEVNEFEKKSKEPTNRGKFVYKFPELKSHKLKKEQIKNEEKMKELMRLKQKEIQRYNLERQNFLY